MLQLLLKLAGWLTKNKGKTIVYVAGKVTGLEYNDVFWKFRLRQMELEEIGYAVINPCEWVDANCDWEKAMRMCTILLSAAHQINLLDCWKDSAGATIEKELAEKIGVESLVISLFER